MATGTDQRTPGETQIIVRYWASARAAAGVNEDRLEADGPLTLTEVRRRVLALHPDAEGFERVIAVCSVLLDDEPVGSFDPDQVQVRLGRAVEFLPPFAGG